MKNVIVAENAHSPIDGGTVLVTGASAGIGRELAVQVAPRARSLVLLARRAGRLEELRTDIAKLAGSGFAGKRAILIYGFEDPHRPLCRLIDAFEAVAARTAMLGPRREAPLRELVHPVFAAGRVYAWEIL